MNEKETKISQVNLKEIRRKIRRAVCQDGMDSITLGIGLLVFPLLDVLDTFVEVTDVFVYSILISGLSFATLLSFLFRKKITFKRVGYYKSKKVVLPFVFGFCFLLLIFLGRDLIRMDAGREYFDSIKPIYFGLWYAFGTFTYMYFLGYKMKTGVIFSLLFLLISCSAMLFSIEKRALVFNYAFFMMALIIISTGIVQSYRFLKKYPKQVEELNYDD